MQLWIKKLRFSKINSVNLNKSLVWIRTRDLWFTNLTIQPMSYDDNQQNRLIQAINQTI